MVVCAGLWLLQTQSVVASGAKIINTYYIMNETESVDLPCGNLSDDVIAIEWSLHKSNKMKKILKFYHTTPGSSPRYYNGYTAENYTISESVNTSMVVQRIDLSEVAWFTCRTIGGTVHYEYIVIIQVVGKLLLTYLVLGVVIQHILCLIVSLSELIVFY